MSTKKDNPSGKSVVRSYTTEVKANWPGAARSVLLAVLRKSNGLWLITATFILLGWFAHILGKDGLKEVLLGVIATGPEAGLGWALALVLGVVVYFQRRHYQGHIKELADARTRLESQLGRAGTSSTGKQKLKIGVEHDI